LFEVLQASGPGWIKDLYRYAKDENLALYGESGSIAETMLLYFGEL